MSRLLTELFDIAKLQRMCDAFTSFSGIALAVLDTKGTIHVATGWQDICLNFHRKHAQTAQRCLESDTIMANADVKEGAYTIYTCKNGLTEVAFPIFVKSEHVGNFFTGQFFSQTPDRTYFDKQAEQFGFDPLIYSTALDKVPLYDRSKLSHIIDYLTQVTQSISDIGVERLAILENKQSHIRELEYAVAQRTLELEQANTALSSANAKLQALSVTDTLTHVGNRRALDEFCLAEWKRFVRHGGELAVFMIDVDHFKLYNDHYGHRQGDKCLQQIASVIKRCVSRDTDFVGRYGGEEFICILTHTPCEGLLCIAESIKSAIRELVIPHETSPCADCVTVSIGISVCNDSRYFDSLYALINAADVNLYHAKQAGRDRVIA